MPELGSPKICISVVDGGIPLVLCRRTVMANNEEWKVLCVHAHQFRKQTNGRERGSARVCTSAAHYCQVNFSSQKVKATLFISSCCICIDHTKVGVFFLEIMINK